MPILAAGSRGTATPGTSHAALVVRWAQRVGNGAAPKLHSHWLQKPVQHGFTLLELLLVIAIVAVVSTGAVLALRDSAQAALEAEAQRLAAVLEQARAQSRASGVAVRWSATPRGFALDGKPQDWWVQGMEASSEHPLVLGPEPLIPPQSVKLWLTEQPLKVLRVATDGVRPFEVTGPFDAVSAKL
jgi:general secretion pathway protein H